MSDQLIVHAIRYEESRSEAMQRWQQLQQPCLDPGESSTESEDVRPRKAPQPLRALEPSQGSLSQMSPLETPFRDQWQCY